MPGPNMTPFEIAQKLRHDIKYAGLTIQNIDLSTPLEPWAQKAIHKDLFATRKGNSCLILAQEAFSLLKETPYADICQKVIEAAETLEPYKNTIQQNNLEDLKKKVALLLRAADALLNATKK